MNQELAKPERERERKRGESKGGVITEKEKKKKKNKKEKQVYRRDAAVQYTQPSAKRIEDTCTTRIDKKTTPTKTVAKQIYIKWNAC